MAVTSKRSLPRRADFKPQAPHSRLQAQLGRERPDEMIHVERLVEQFAGQPAVVDIISGYERKFNTVLLHELGRLYAPIDTHPKRWR